MRINPFSEKRTDDMILERKRELLYRIDSLKNEEIMANDIEILVENLYQEFFIEPVTIFDEDFSKRTIRQEKVKKCNGSFREGHYGNARAEVDGVVLEVHYPFIGCAELFKCRASTFLQSRYSPIELLSEELVFSISESIEEAKHGGKEKMVSEIREHLNEIKQGISFANSDIEKYNSDLKLHVWKKLNEKKQKVQTFFDFAKMFEVPIEKKEYAQKHIPVKRRIVPIAHEYNRKDYYGLKDSDYRDILVSIKHTASTYERTPSSYKSMQEEDLRNTLLAALNATYQGNATGETFRNNGKTDICIEQKNRAAFVAECKMWKGQKEVEVAIQQLDSYLTWRDCKTALIYFVKRKDFIGVLEKVYVALADIEGMKNVNKIDENEFECLYMSKVNIGQQIKIRVMLFNLYYDSFR